MRNPNSIALPLVFNLILFSLVLFPACVTVNVNIPEGEIQQASDDYVKELYDAKEQEKSSEAGITTATTTATATAATTAGRPLQLVKTNSPKAEEIKARMKARRSALKAKKIAGQLGESNDGMLTIRGTLTGDAAQEARKLVDDENTDRKSLFKEIGRQSHQSAAGLAAIEKSFARAFQDHSPSNTWVQDEDGAWSQKQ